MKPQGRVAHGRSKDTRWIEGDSLSLLSLKDNYIEWLIFRQTSSSSAWKKTCYRGDREGNSGKEKRWSDEAEKKASVKIGMKSLMETRVSGTCLCWHQAGHEATWEQDGATQHHFSHQQWQNKCEESCSSPIWLNTHSHKHLGCRKPFPAQAGGKPGHLLMENVVDSPVTNRHPLFSLHRGSCEATRGRKPHLTSC